MAEGCWPRRGKQDGACRLEAAHVLGFGGGRLAHPWHAGRLGPAGAWRREATAAPSRLDFHPPRHHHPARFGGVTSLPASDCSTTLVSNLTRRHCRSSASRSALINVHTAVQPRPAAIQPAAPAVHAAGTALLPPPLLLPTQTGHDPLDMALVPAAHFRAVRECIVLGPLGSNVSRHLSAAVSLG